LIAVLDRLVEAGNTVIVIEHNLDVIKMADHIIDLGPEGGEDGGQIVTMGDVETVSKDPRSHTGKFLQEKLLKDGKRLNAVR
jgi:excinuclease ABC subunit A